MSLTDFMNENKMYVLLYIVLMVIASIVVLHQEGLL
jgi:cell division protein FtsL